MPDNWAQTRLSDVCSTINGLWKGKKPPYINAGVIRNANFTKSFQLDYSNIEFLDIEEASFKKRSLKNGDLIIEKSGGSDKNPVGRAILYEGKDDVYSFSNFTMSLRIHDKDSLIPKYLYYHLLRNYHRGDMSSMQTQTTGLHNLIMDRFMGMIISLPPLPEQIRIINKIERLFGELDNIKTLLQ